MKKFSLEEFLAHPEKKVVLECGVEAEILAIDKSGEYPIVCMAKKDGAIPFRCDKNGKAYNLPEGANYSDLFFADEEELTEFEDKIYKIVQLADSTCSSPCDLKQLIKDHSEELLELARKEIEEELKEKVFSDYGLVFHEACRKAKEEGKAETLKDLPRWGKAMYMHDAPVVDSEYLYLNNYCISLSDLEKLPKDE